MIRIWLLTGMLWASTALAAGATHTVRIEGMKFHPDLLQVRPGDTVVWINADIVPHTVTAQEQGIESGTIAATARWSITLKQPGDVSYVCRFHPMMKAVVSVRR
jgi:plastocyanin